MKGQAHRTEVAAQPLVTKEARVRLVIVRWVLDGRTIEEAAERYGYNRKTITGWLRRYREAGPTGLNDRQGVVVRRKHSKIPPRVRQLIREARLQHPEWAKHPIMRWLMQQGYKLPPSTVHQLVRDVEPRIRLGDASVLLFEVSDVDARNVRITGDFLEWSKDGLPLTKAGQGKWSLAIRLAPGDYTCRFLLDGRVIMLPERESGRRGTSIPAVAFTDAHGLGQMSIQAIARDRVPNGTPLVHIKGD